MSFLNIALLICAVVAVPQNSVEGVLRADSVKRLATSSHETASIETSSTALVSTSTVTDFATSAIGSVSVATDTSRNTDTEISTLKAEDPANREISTDVLATMSSVSASWLNHKEKDTDITILDYLGKIVTPVTLAVGLTGNAAILYALQGHVFNKIPSRYILSALAVSDSSALIMNTLNKNFVIDIIGQDIRAYNRNTCIIFYYFTRLGILLSSWFVVLICCERFVAICLPLRAKLICTKSNAKWAITIVVVTLASFNGIWTLLTEKVGSKCSSSFWTPDTEIRGKVIMYIGTVLLGLLPMIIMIILTPTMCIVLHRNHLSRKRLTTSDNPEMTKVSAMLISVCVAYIVLLLPIIVVHNMAFALGENLYASRARSIVILKIVAENMAAINFSCNFFLYISCNASFRRRLFCGYTCFENKCPAPAPTLSTISM